MSYNSRYRASFNPHNPPPETPYYPEPRRQQPTTRPPPAVVPAGVARCRRGRRLRTGLRPLRRGPAPERGGGVDLGRRGALGRRQRPHHRSSLQDRRGGPGCGGRHHTPATLRALDALRPAGVSSGEKVFGLSDSQDCPPGAGGVQGRGLAD